MPPIYTQADTLQGLLNLLPRGRIWPKDPSSNMVQVMSALAPAFQRLSDRGGNLIGDGFPGTTVELLPEWEASLGLPDPCLGASPTLAARRGEVVARFVGLGGQSIPFFQAYAAALGYQIQIQEYAPFFAERGTADSALLDENAAYLWNVNAPQQTLHYFDADLSTAGEPLVAYQSTVLQCEFSRLKPAHTIITYAFALPSNMMSTGGAIAFPAFSAFGHGIDVNIGQVAFPAFSASGALTNPVSLRGLATMQFTTKNATISNVSAAASMLFGAFAARGMMANGTPTVIREPYLQPYASASPWNSPIGANTIWSASTDADTVALRNLAFGIAPTAVVVGQASDPVIQITSTSTAQRDAQLTAFVHVPIGTTTATDGLLTLYDTTQPTIVYTFTGVQIFNSGGGLISATTASCSITAVQGEQDTICGSGADSDTQNWGYGTAGVIRQWEWSNGKVDHSLRLSLPAARVNLPAILPYPAYKAIGTPGTGPIGYGITVGIPATVNLTTLGLSPGGLIVATALQNHGAIMRLTNTATGGQIGAEATLDTDPLITAARADLVSLIPSYLSILRNQSAATINGGGAAIVAAPPVLDPNVCGAGIGQAPSVPSGLAAI